MLEFSLPKSKKKKFTFYVLCQNLGMVVFTSPKKEEINLTYHFSVKNMGNCL